MRIFFVVIAALIVAINTGYYVLSGVQSPAAPVVAVEVEVPRQTEVFVPAVELAAGSIIKPEHLGRIGLADSAVTAEMVVADDDGRMLLVGSVARQSLPKGLPIARSATVQPGDRGFLAAVLPQGKRAISIPLSEVAGVSGLVVPGDRVDIILTYSVAGETIDAGRDIRASETVISNLRVLALDQRLQAVSQPDDGAVVTAPVARTATLEVTSQEAEMLTLATRLGDLSLVLNSVRDGGDPVAGGTAGDGRAVALQPRALTLDSDVTSLLQRQLALRRAAEDAEATPVAAAVMPLVDRNIRVQVVRGIESRAVEFSGAAEPDGAGDAATAIATAVTDR